MKFDPVAHMEWAKLESRARVNLSRSGVPGLGFRDLGLDLEGIEINGEHPYGYPPLVEAIAARHGAAPATARISSGDSQTPLGL